MAEDSIDPTITSAVTEIVNRFGAPGLDQLERATALARPEARSAVIALVEQPQPAVNPPTVSTPPVDQDEPGRDPHPRDDEPARIDPRITSEPTDRLAEWRAASDAVRSECETFWARWAEQEAPDRSAPDEEDRRRLNAYYAVEQAARDQFFALIESAP